MPKLAQLVRDYPQIQMEIIVDYGLVDVVTERFDAGVRLGEQVAKDMIGVPISPVIPMAVVGAPDYFERRPPPQQPQQLLEHQCLNLWLPSLETVNEWLFFRQGMTTRVRVNGSLTFNTLDLIRDAALKGLGLAYLPLDQVEQDLAAGRLVSVLQAWMQDLPAYYLYYPNRRQSSPVFKLVVDTLRHRS
ncbi:MAG: LysR substrate-binding domain-containing protein [Thiolinea sp.]